MAKVTAADFVRPSEGSWAAKVRAEHLARIEETQRAQAEETNRDAKAAEVLTQIAQEYPNTPDNVLRQIHQQIVQTGDFDVALLSETTDPVLPQEAPAEVLPTVNNNNAVDDTALVLRRGTRNVAGGLIGLPVDLLNLAIENPVQRAVSAVGESVGIPRTPNILELLGGDRTISQPDAVTGTRESISVENLEDTRRYQSDRFAQQEREFAETEGLFGALSYLARRPSFTALMGAEQLPQLLVRIKGSTAGTIGAQAGLAGAMNEGQVRSDLQAQVEAGTMTQAEADEAASNVFAASATLNTALPLLPGASTIERSAAGEALGQAARRTAVTGAVRGGAGEAVAGGIGEGADQVISNLGTGDAWDEGVAQAAALGIVAEGALGTAAGGAEGFTQTRERRASNEQDILAGGQRALDAQIARETAADQDINRQLFEAEEDIRRQEEAVATSRSLEEALSAREAEQARQRELEEEAGFRTIERDRDQLTSRVERYADVVERVPVNPAAEITPEQIEAEREAQAQLEAEAARVREINQVATRRAAIDKRAAEAATKAEKKQAAATRAQRNKAIDELIAANPTASDADIADALPSKLADLAATPKQEAPKKATAKRKEGAPPPSVDLARLKASTNPLDRAQAEVLERLGAVAPEQATAGDYSDKVKSIAKALAGDTSKRAAAVEKLVRDGKVIIVPNATSIGRSELNRVGEFDPNDGSTYIYTDNLGDNVHASIMEATAHETAHLGQFNPRDSRPEMVQALLGNKTTSDGAKKLRIAARQGNRFAQQALAAAEADTAQRREAGEANPSRYEDVELVAYAVGAENAGRTSTLGSAGGAIRDAVAGARKQVRNKLGIDLDISVGDLRAAMAQVLQEGTATDAASSDGDRLGMVAGRKAVNAERAEAEGKMYTLPGIPDSKERWEFSDSEAEILTAPLVAGLERVTPTNAVKTDLSRVLDHPRLFEEYPQLRQYKLRISQLPGTSYGSFNRDTKDITINSALLEAAVDNPNEISPVSEAGLTHYEFVRNVILHEVQHAIQNIEGFTGGASYNNALVKKAFDNRNSAMQEYNDYISMWAETLPEVVSSLPQDISEAWEEILGDSKGLSPVGRARLFLQYGLHEHSPVSRYKASGRKFASIDAKKNASQKAYVDARQLADKTYYDVHGEVEARNTETRSRMTEEEIAQSPTTSTYDTPVEDTLPERGNTVVQSQGERLGMAAPSGSKAAFRNKNKLTTFITAALRNDKGLGAHIRNEVELAKAAPVEFEAKANLAAGKFDSAVRAMAKQQNTTPEKLNNQIRDELEAIADTEGSASEYSAKFNEIVSKYGKAGDALKQLRGIVDDLSADFIRTYLDSGAKLTNKEKDDVRKVAANLGRYVHRFYASRLGRGLGEQYSQAVQDAVDAAEKDGVKSLTPKQKELYDRYAGVAKNILDGVMIPDAEGMSDLRDSNVDYLYDTWVGTDPTGVTREEKETALLEMREEIGPEDLQQKVDAATQALLWGVKENAASRYYDRGEKLDTTILQKRSQIPKEIRALMGEVTDPAAALVNTVSKQAELVARTKLMFALRNMASPQDLQPPGSAGNTATRENNMVELTGEAYGPLRGYFASPSMLAMIDDTSQQLQNFTEAMTTGSQNYESAVQAAARTAANVWTKGASAAKAINIVGNLFRYPLNLVGSFGMLGLNGNLNVKSYGRGLTDAIDIIRYAARPAAGLGGAELASKYRVVDSATVGDLKNLDVGKIEQVVRGMSGKSPGAFMRKARELGMAGRETYAMMDVWSKIANFHAEADFLKSLYKAEGTDKSDDEIYREASAIVNNTNMSYARTAPFVKAIERGGITQYGPYMYEAHRVILANLYQGAQELYRAKDLKPKAAALMASRGTARIAGTSAVLGMLGALSHFAAGMWGDDEEDKRALLPEYARVMDFFSVGKDESGKPVLYAVSNIDPLGPTTDLYRAARLGDEPFESAWAQFKENYIAPSLGGALWDATARTTGLIPATSTRPRKPLVQQWFPEGWSAVTGTTGGEDKWASIAHLMETRFMPGTARAWSDSNPIAAGGTRDEIAYNVARGLGARGLRYDPRVGATNASFAYDDTMKTLRRSLTAYVETTTNPDAEEITSRLLDLREEEKKVWDQLASTRRGMVALGLSEDDADEALKEARVPKELISQLANNEYVSRVISEQSIQSAAKLQAKKARTDEEKEKIKAKWDTAWEILSELQGEQ